MNVAEYFKERKQDREQALQYAESSGFQFLELLDGNWVDITERRKQEIRAEIDEYQRCIEMFGNS
jgi:hypothetical protein